jgi:hypothetical protein
MPWKCTKQKLNALQRRCDELRQEAGQLLSTRSAVCRRVVLLESLCDCLAVYKGRTTEDALDGSSCPEGYHELLQQEQLLLSELQTLQAGTWDPHELPHLGMQTIAPRSDPLALFRRHLAQAPSTLAANLTALEVAGKPLCDCRIQTHTCLAAAHHTT